ncbi:MAG: hypothetical protein EOP49_04935 [Sphingobacteriales bacterium]|nr:MAG: hypothetical protein EOP49_04935 [Sphingobacteriales bacterium]
MTLLTPPRLRAERPSFALRVRVCRYLDAMLVSRDMRGNKTAFSQRVAEEDKARLVRERFFLLKACMVHGEDAKVPYLYNLK